MGNSVSEMINAQISSKLVRIAWLEEQFKHADCYAKQERYLKEATKKKLEIEELRGILREFNGT